MNNIKYLLTIVTFASFIILWYVKDSQIEELKSTITTMEQNKKKADDKVKEVIVEKEKLVTKEVVKYKDKVIFVNAKDTKTEVITNAEKIDAGCFIGSDFIRMHDKIVRARNQDTESSDTAGTEPGTKETGTYSCAEVMMVIDENYKRFEENRILYESTRDAWTKAGE